MSGLKDFAILEAIRNGSDRILFKLYSEYRDQFIGWSLSNHNLTIDEAKDIFQDSIIAFHENIRSGKVQSLNSTIETYLFGIGKNKIRDHFKSKDVIRKHQESLADSMEAVEEDSDKKELIHDIKLILSSMKTRCREVLQLFYLKGIDMDSIAKELGFKNADVAKKTKYECMKSLETKVKLMMKEM